MYDNEWVYEDDHQFQEAEARDFGMDDDECEIEDDGQPTEYEEWQDLYGGDDWDQGQYDCEY